jgi:steroid 5-alpha reductase family enzyme
MLWTLLYGTGVPHAERQALLHRGQDYRDYQASTHTFFPWFPKSKTL